MNKVTITIPVAIIEHMSKLGIPEDRRQDVFTDYLRHLLGIGYGMELDTFMVWTDTSDSIADWVI
jgi:hypothetical protein